MAGLIAKPNSDRPMLGICFILLTYLLFSMLDSSAKWLVLSGMTALQVAFVRYAGHFLIAITVILRGGFNLNRLGTQNLGLVVLRAFLLMGSTIFNFMALRYIPLTLTSTIMFSAPVIICALSGPLLGERVGIWRWFAIFVGFCGVLVAIRPFDVSFHWAVSLSLINVICFSLYSILTRKLSGRVASDTLQLYSGAIGTCVFLPFALLQWQNPVSALDWTVMLALGFFGWLGHEFLTRAHGYAEASSLTPFSYVFIIYMTTSSYLVFDHAPDNSTLAGAAIVVTAGLVIWFRERRLNLRRQTVTA